MNELLL